MSVYDPNLWDNMTPANVRGGQARAIKALRDKLGRFLPNDPFLREMWQLDPEHGRKGGLTILEKYGREHFKALAQQRKNGQRDKKTD